MRSLVNWFAANSIAANLLMVMVLVAGIASLSSTDKEVFPGALANQIEVSVAYPGAGPREVEEQICIRVEEAVATLDGIKEITSVARQSVGTVLIEVASGYDSQRLLNNVKSKVDAITTFPVDAERPLVSERQFTSDLMSLALYGDVDERVLKDTAQYIRDEISLLPGVSLVQVDATRSDEMAVELDEQALQRYGLSFDQVVAAIQRSSVNLPAGVIKSRHGDIQIQTRGQAYSASDFGAIVVLTEPNGAQVFLRDLAKIVDGFEETDLIARYNGKPAAFIELYVTEHPNVLATSKSVRDYLTILKPNLPAGLSLDVSRDWSTVFSARLKLLVNNALSGLVLVFVILMLFLRPALALWVCSGITVAFAGAIWIMPMLGVSFNMLSLFAFLLILGIVVDDAIIVSESIYTTQQAGHHGVASAKMGVHKVSGPVFFAVISTVIFFIPMLFVPNTLGDIVYPIPVIVISCLLFSMIESMLILPAHLAHLKPEKEAGNKLERGLKKIRSHCATRLERLAQNIYRPFIDRCLQNVKLPIAVFSVLFLITLTVYGGGWIKQSFMPQVPSDFLHAKVELEEGVAFSQAQAILEKIESAAEKLKFDPQLIAANDDNPAFIRSVEAWATPQSVRVRLALMDAEVRKVGSPAVARRWRVLIGDIPEAKDFDVGYTINARDKSIRLRVGISDNNLARQAEALAQVKAALASYPGVRDIKDSLQSARDEIEITLRPHAELLGLGLQDIARQVRQGFYGAEAQRIPRGKEDVRVKVRYTRTERESVASLEQMRIRTQAGDEVPIGELANLDFVPGYTEINRVDRQRANAVTAELESDDSAQALAIVNAVMNQHGDQWRQAFPGFRLEVAGDLKEQNEFMSELMRDFVLSLFAIYALMAIAFRSYGQPLLIMTAIPFGFMGAVFGHLLLGREISMLSMLGFLACAGVVVNDNLVLIDRINQLRKRGMAVIHAVAQAGEDRFRAIILTSLTTFIGLTPILTETSVQARFLIPMVISLAFGVLLATGVTLVLVPSLYLAGYKLKSRWHRAWRRITETRARV